MTQLKIISIKNEVSGIYSLVFKKPSSFFYYPGQYIDIYLKDTKDSFKTRAFTLSSSPTEDFLMVTTRIGSSKFKKTLGKLKIGGLVEISHPAGTFIYDPTEPSFFITNGVGITPFRSILKSILDNQQSYKPINLFYFDKTESFLFKQELEKWQKKLKKFTIHYNLQPKNLPSNNIYYLSGSPEFVKNFYKLLKSKGIDEVNIRTDEFDGYL